RGMASDVVELASCQFSRAFIEIGGTQPGDHGDPHVEVLSDETRSDALKEHCAAELQELQVSAGCEDQLLLLFCGSLRAQLHRQVRSGSEPRRIEHLQVVRVEACGKPIFQSVAAQLYGEGPSVWERRNLFDELV